MKKVVLDFSSRLPGPRATSNLLAHDFDVIKIEDINYPDFFSTKEIPQFNYWYESFNQAKEILRVDFNTYDFSELINKADIILMGLNSKNQKKYKLDFANIKKTKICYIEITANRDETPAHDLNLLADTSFFQLHLNDQLDSQNPPFVPVLGIEYSNLLTEKILASYIKLIETSKAVYERVYFEDVLKRFNFLEKIEIKPILHNGDLPCYRIYRSKDGVFISFAAAEVAFWDKFCQIFNLNLRSEDRFDKTGTIIKKIERLFLSLNADEIKTILNNEEICINLVKKES